MDLSRGVVDRFMPYRSSRMRPSAPLATGQSSPTSFHLQNGHFLVSPVLQPTRNQEEIPIERDEPEVIEPVYEPIRDSLGLPKDRVLTFKPSKWNPQAKASFNIDREQLSKNPRKDHAVQELMFKVLDAPGLRNDYYSDTVCWTHLSNGLAVGLGSSVYIWSEKQGAVLLQHLAHETITALCYSDTDVLAVGTKTGKVLTYERGTNLLRGSFQLKSKAGITCIKWIPGKDLFFAGDEAGYVAHYMWNEAYGLAPSYIHRCSKQQICGMDVRDNQLAIGTNDNRCIVCNLHPVLMCPKFELEHTAAVKAVAFCPWLPHLLATGGGSKDRCIRFWHTGSGTLISKYETSGQVTSLIWSTGTKQLLATFGFSSAAETNLAVTYLYPSMKVKARVPGSSDLRVLTAHLSFDHSMVCAGLSDQSVRIYSVWHDHHGLTGWYETGLFQSKLIEFTEGIGGTMATIR